MLHFLKLYIKYICSTLLVNVYILCYNNNSYFNPLLKYNNGFALSLFLRRCRRVKEWEGERKRKKCDKKRSCHMRRKLLHKGILLVPLSSFHSFFFCLLFFFHFCLFSLFTLLYPFSVLLVSYYDHTVFYTFNFQFWNGNTFSDKTQS